VSWLDLAIAVALVVLVFYVVPQVLIPAIGQRMHRRR
jgi:hypothetical protein